MVDARIKYDQDVIVITTKKKSDDKSGVRVVTIKDELRVTNKGNGVKAIKLDKKEVVTSLRLIKSDE